MAIFEREETRKVLEASCARALELISTDVKKNAVKLTPQFLDPRLS